MQLTVKSLEFIALIKGLLKFKTKEDELLLFSYLSSTQTLLVSLSSKPEKIVFSIPVEETPFLCDLNFAFNLDDFSRVNKLKKKEAKELLEINDTGISILDSTLSFKFNILESNVQLSILQSIEFTLDTLYLTSIKNILKNQKDLLYLQLITTEDKSYFLFVGTYQISLVEIAGSFEGFETRPFLLNSTTLNSLLSINDEIIFFNNFLISDNFVIDLSLIEVKPEQTYIFKNEFLQYLFELNYESFFVVDASKDKLAEIEAASFVDSDYKLCKLEFEKKELEFIREGESVSHVANFITTQDYPFESLYLRVDNLIPALKMAENVVGHLSLNMIDTSKPIMVELDSYAKTYMMPSVVME